MLPFLFAEPARPIRWTDAIFLTLAISVIRPTPAIVAQSAVRRLPRVALILLCAAYVLPGYFGREPWKNADIAAFGYMLELAGTPLGSAWLAPTIMGMEPEVDALLPYWLGAWAIEGRFQHFRSGWQRYAI